MEVELGGSRLLFESCTSCSLLLSIFIKNIFSKLIFPHPQRNKCFENISKAEGIIKLVKTTRTYQQFFEKIYTGAKYKLYLNRLQHAKEWENETAGRGPITTWLSTTIINCTRSYTVQVVRIYKVLEVEFIRVGSGKRTHNYIKRKEFARTWLAFSHYCTPSEGGIWQIALHCCIACTLAHTHICIQDRRFIGRKGFYMIWNKAPKIKNITTPLGLQLFCYGTPESIVPQKCAKNRLFSCERMLKIGPPPSPSGMLQSLARNS